MRTGDLRQVFDLPDYLTTNIASFGGGGAWASNFAGIGRGSPEQKPPPPKPAVTVAAKPNQPRPREVDVGIHNQTTRATETRRGEPELPA